MPMGVAVPAASSGFRFSSPYLRVMSAATLSWGTMGSRGTALIPDSEKSLEYRLVRGLCQIAQV
jgi:hypothetical protein